MILPSSERKVITLPRSHVHPDPDQPRKEFPLDKLKELADSLRVHKQLVAGIVRPYPDRDGHFLIIDCERRWRALALVPCDTIDVVVVTDPLEPGELLMMQMSLGLTSERLNPLELGEGCQRLMRLYNVTPEVLAERLGTSTSTLSKLFRIVKIAEPLREDVKSGALPFTVAYQIARLKEVPQQLDIAAKFKAELLKRDSVAAEVGRLLGGGPKPSKAKPIKAHTARGLQAVFPTGDYDHVLGELATLTEAVKRAQKHGLPLASVPSLLKGA
jgi:ParB family chromosome partitioning protein